MQRRKSQRPFHRKSGSCSFNSRIIAKDQTILTHQTLRALFKAKSKDSLIRENLMQMKAFKNSIQKSLGRGFLKLCRKNIGVTAAKIVNQILLQQSSISRLQLDFNRLGERGISRIVDGLRQGQIVHLSLKNNNLSGEGLVNFFKLSRNNHTLVSLDLSNSIAQNKNIFSLQAFKELGLFIGSNPAFLAIGLEHCNIREESFELICQGMAGRCSLKVVNLRNNDLKKFGPRAIDLLISSDLEILNLNNNKFVNGLFDGYSDLNQFRIQKLYIENNGMTSKGANSTIQMLRIGKNLLTLKMSYNQVSQLLVGKLIIQGALQTLELQKCSLESYYLQDICQAITNRYSYLRQLNLSKNTLHKKDIQLLTRAIASRQVLQKLKLSSCQIDDQTGSLLINSLRKNNTIEVLDLSNNFLGDRSGKLIITILQQLWNLQQICLQKNLIQEHILGRIEQLLQANKQYHKKKQAAVLLANLQGRKINSGIEKKQDRIILQKNRLKEEIGILQNRLNHLVNYPQLKLIKKQMLQQHESWKRQIQILNKEQHQIKKQISRLDDQISQLKVNLLKQINIIE